MPDIIWNDQLLTRQPQMDATHREFVDHLIQVEAALGQPDDVLLPRYDALIAHTTEHFEQEDRWMAALGFAPQNCHSMQHTQVLAVLKDVRRQHVEAGQTDMIGRLLPELMQWFENHAQAADAGLAGYMDEVGYDTLTGLMTNPPVAAETAETADTANTGCGSAAC